MVVVLPVNKLVNNRYRIEAILAQGGMGAVYRALDENLGVDVALKQNLSESDEGSFQFLQEAAILAGLRHPHLPRVTDHFILPELGQFLVMDFVEGEDIRQRIERSGKMPVAEVIQIGVEICDALIYLHNRKPPVIHRDIKPSNIKLTPAGQSVLVDFGLAKFARTGEITAIGAKALTPGYAPPEQYTSGTNRFSDVYSLGATLYAALAGAAPEDGYARSIDVASLTPLSQYNPAVSKKLEDVINRAMHVEPQHRFASALEFRKALLECLPEEAKSIPNEKMSENGSSSVQVNTHLGSGWFINKLPYIIIILGVITILCLSTIGGGLLVSRFYPSMIGKLHLSVTVTEKAVETRITSSPEKTWPELFTITKTAAPVIPTDTPVPVLPTGTSVPLLPSEVPTVVMTPVGSGNGQIAFASDRDGGPPQIFLMNYDGSNPQKLTTLAGGACQPSWSPDGKRMLFISPCEKKQLEEYAGSQIYVMDADGSAPQQLPIPPAGGDFDPAWSPDGNRIAFASIYRITADQLPHLFLYKFDSQTVEPLLTSLPGRHPAWSPDGSRIAFEYTRMQRVWLINANGTGEPAGFSPSYGFAPVWSPKGDMIAYGGRNKLPLLTSRLVDNRLAPENNISGTLRPVWNMSFSRDGLWLIFDLKEEGIYDIYRINLSGSGLTRITSDNGNNFHPACRP